MLRVATYNVHDCIGRDGVYAPDRIAAIVARLHADVVALQEMTLDHAGDIVALIEQTTGMRAIDGTLFERGVGRYGNLLLCRGMVTRQQLVDLSCPDREPRGLVGIQVTSNARVYDIFATHLGLGLAERRAQFRQLELHLAQSENPAVLMGDFNAILGRLEFSPLLRLGTTMTTRSSFPTAFGPLLSLDRILLNRHARFIRSWPPAAAPIRKASDHFPIVAEIQAKPEPA